MALDLTVLDGNFKDQFHKDVENLIPDHVILQQGMIDWVPSDKQNGQFYSIPTLLRSNQGVTYLGESGALGTLKSAKPGQMKEAQIFGSELNVRGQLSYKMLSQASEKGPKAFVAACAWLVEDLAQVAHTRIEIAALHGQTGLGSVSTITNVSGTNYDIVITDTDFAPGMWVLLEGATVEFFSNATVSSGVQRSNSSNIVGTVKKVTTSSKTINMDLNVANANGNAIAGGDVIFFEGAVAVPAGVGQTISGFNEMMGLYKQLTTTSGTLFNIDRSQYSLMQGNVVNIGGAITKAKILSKVMLAVDKGALKDLTVLVGTASFADLHAEDLALRRFDSSYSDQKTKSGSREIVYTSLNGQCKVVCHPLVKNGNILIFAPEDCLWVGSSKPTFEIPGVSQIGAEKFFRVLTDSNGVELQNYADMAIYHMRPCQSVVLTGITHP